MSSGRRRVAWWTGLIFFLVGLTLLGYAAWQFYGTNWVAHRRQGQVLEDVRRGWASGHDRVRTQGGEVAAVIRIPRFGPDYEVPVFAGTSDHVLARGFGHFDGSAGPGQVGNYALAAHRVTNGEPLRRMPDLRVGDQIEVVTRSTTYVYRLTTDGDDLVVPFTSTWVTDPLPTNPERGGVQPAQRPGQRLITLTTCAELFHTDNRTIAFGVLSRAVPRP